MMIILGMGFFIGVAGKISGVRKIFVRMSTNLPEKFRGQLLVRVFHF